MKTIFKVTLFTIVGFILALIIGKKLDFKSESAERVIKPYFKNKIKTDVLSLGSSHVLYGINTEIIETENDIKAYNLADTGQKIEQSYFLLKESLINNQIPKIVILEIFGSISNFGEKYSYFSFSKTFNYLNDKSLKNDFIKETKFKPARLKILDTHSNWNLISKTSLKDGVVLEDFFKNRKLYNGYFYETEIQIKDFDIEKLKTVNIYKIPLEPNLKEFGYISKIKELCENYNIKLIVIKTPVINYYLDEEKYLPLNKKIENFMKNENIIYIDYNLKQNWEKINLNYNKDFLNNGHLNQSGAKKLTLNLAPFIKKIYLENRK
ncbi:MAG: hypothetical protein ACRC0Y_06000 [Fusobacteriaceae bacterium]